MRYPTDREYTDRRGSGVMFAVIDVCLIAQVSVTALAKSVGVNATRISGSVARMESRLRIDNELKKVVDDIVSAFENSKYQA